MKLYAIQQSFNIWYAIHVYISKTCYGFLLTLCWSCWLISFSKCQIPYITRSTIIRKIRSISINDGLALKPLLLISFSLVLVIVLSLKVGFHYYMFYIKKYLPENEFSTKQSTIPEIKRKTSVRLEHALSF